MNTPKLKPTTTKYNNNTNNKESTNPQTNPAFTIIEVVLVLAIAGLIFLMVFIALPTSQRNQRDTRRKNDMSRLKTTIDSYKSNNRGNLPWGTDRYGVWSQSDNFGINYLKADQGEFNDPSRGPYQLTISRPYMIPGYKPALQDSWISIFIGGKCDGEVLALADGSSNYSIQYILEGGGVYCIDG
ncbi:MAG: type II secretion system protein [Candidatus Nanogingivalis sp.]